MALTKSERAEINELFEKAINTGRNKEKDKFKQTEKRLYAYPILKRNIERYKLDIEDVKQEDMKKSKDFVLFLKNSGGNINKPDLEDLRAAKILRIEQKIARDEKEVVEIDAALKEIREDEYCKVIDLHYFKRENQERIAKIMNCDKVTAWRNKTRLIKNMAISLYGADAL